MRALALLGLVFAACGAAPGFEAPGSLPEPTLGPTSPESSSLRDRVGQLAATLSFQPFVPDDVPQGLMGRPSLRSDSAEGAPGEPLLVVEFTDGAAERTTLLLIEGPGGCCLAYSRGYGVPADGAPPVKLDTLIRSRAPLYAGDPHSEVRGELIRDADGLTLWWHESALPGGRTYLALKAPKGFDEQTLLRVARSMRGVDRPASRDAVLLYWSTHESHNPAGHRVFVGAIGGALPDEARLLDADGQVVASARFEQPKFYHCLRGASAVAPLAVPLDVVHQFMRMRAGGYRVEVFLGGTWRAATLVASGCASIE